MILSLYREPFEPELLQKVAEAINSDAENITVYLSSTGGKISVMTALLEMVNSNKDRINLVAYDYIGSAAFVFFIKAECNKKALKNTIAMHHQTLTNVDLNEFKKPYYKSDEAELIRMKKEHEDSQEFNQQIGLTPNEIKRYNQNEHLYFQHDRLIELIENYNKNN